MYTTPRPRDILRVTGFALVAISFLLIPSFSVPPPALSRAAPLRAMNGKLAMPSARGLSGVTYDPLDGYALLFGGVGYKGMTNDTWKFVNATWTRLHPSVAPSPRTGMAMAYDRRDGWVVLFGGEAPNGSALGDTWSYIAGQWTLLSPVHSPMPRWGATMVYDAADRYLLLFGGNSNRSLLGDTWKFVAGHWKHLHPANSPPPLRSAGATYDVVDGYVVLFGGVAKTGDLGGTWEFQGGNWTQLAPAAAPPALVAPSMAFDRHAKEVILFGGRNDNFLTFYNETWTYAGGNWTLLNSTVSPLPRDWAALAYSEPNHYLVLFGGSAGYAGGFLGDTWTMGAAGNWNYRYG